MDLYTRLNQRMADKLVLPEKNQCLQGRAEPMQTASRHLVLGNALHPPFPGETETLIVGMGCFWGAERLFWQMDGVHTTAVGYSGGFTLNPTYEEVCSGKTGHTEVVLIVYYPADISLEKLLVCFWESHDPTQGMRQGNDVGTQYRSAVYASDVAQLERIKASRDRYAGALAKAGHRDITTEIAMAGEFYYAEDYHQQYLAKNPNGYCGLQGAGVPCIL